MIVEGCYVPTKSHGKRAAKWRRIVGQLNGMVRYTHGNDCQHGACKEATFIGWIRRYEAKLQIAQNQAPLNLRHD